MLAKKNSAINVFIDFDRAQKISGLVASVAIFVAIIGVLLLPKEKVDGLSLGILFAGVLLFIIIYYAIPKLYLNPKLKLLPDFVYLSGSVFAVSLLGAFGPYFFIYFYLLIMINAFIFSYKEFVTVTVFAVLLINAGALVVLKGQSEIHFVMLIQTYSLIAVAVVSRFFAKYTLNLRDKKIEIESLNKQILGDKKEVMNLLESIGDGIVSADVNGKIILANKSAAFLLDNLKLEGKNIRDVFKLNTRDNLDYNFFDEAKKSVSDTSLVLIRNDVYFKKNKARFRFYVHLNPIISDNCFNGLIVLFRDVTKEKLSEEQNTEFVAIASHEIRTPLTQIEGFLYLALNQLKDADPATLSNVQAAHNASVSLIGLTNDILTIFKIDNNNVEVALKKFRLGETVKKTVDNLKEMAKNKGLHMFYLSEIKNEALIVSDELKVAQIINNLVQNAIKFTEKGNIWVTLKEFKGEMVVEVKDTGIGIERSALKHIFDKFYRLENWVTRQSQGTGLGLYIVKNLLERIDGRIDVKSEKDKGTVFTVSLPKEYKNNEDLKRASEEELKNFIGAF